MITEDHPDAAATRPQEVPRTNCGPEKLCASPCSSTSTSPSPSAPKSTASSVTNNSSGSGDEGDGRSCRRNGLLGNVTPDGVLTPPTENHTDTKPLKCNGRLEFYKEGVLCLELSHCEEGQGRKWLKTKGKSDIRQVVRVSKEVSIPCSPSPSNHMINHPPNGMSSIHDMSDDGSSAASSSSSPKSREKSWRKQLVPQKSISTSFQFYMFPSPCIHSHVFTSKKRNPTELTPRRPYALPQPSISSKSNDSCSCGSPRRRRTLVRTKRILNCKPLDALVSKLVLRSESTLKRPKASSPRWTPSKPRSYSNASTSSRKRVARDLDEDSKPSKKIPVKNLEKTILSVPVTKQRGSDATDAKVIDPSSPPATYDHKKYTKSHASLHRPSSNPPERDEEDEDSAQDPEDVLTPEEQQQYAMSRAISYTITSLLSQGTPSFPNDAQYPMSASATFGLEEDKKSFLRHLLDTSDPIPPNYAAVVASAPKQKKLGSSSPSPEKKAKGLIKTKRNKVAVSASDPKSRAGAGRPLGTVSPYALAVTSPAQLESITAAAMQYAHLIPSPSSLAGKVAFTNPALARVGVPPPTTAATEQDGDEAPINLSQKDGDWPDAKSNRASVTEGRPRAFLSVPHENLEDGSDQDLPLDLCKKRRSD